MFAGLLVIGGRGVLRSGHWNTVECDFTARRVAHDVPLKPVIVGSTEHETLLITHPDHAALSATIVAAWRRDLFKRAGSLTTLGRAVGVSSS